MIKVVKTEQLKNYGFKLCRGEYVKNIPIKFAELPPKNIIGIGDEPEVYLCCAIDDNSVDIGHQPFELYSFIEGMSNDYHGTAGLDTIADLLADGVAVVDRE